MAHGAGLPRVATRRTVVRSSASFAIVVIVCRLAHPHIRQ
jgi:hypothetical protein